MKEFLEKLISFIVTEETEFEIKEDFSEPENLTVYTIFVPENEIGKVIGKGGKVISAIRTLCRIKAVKENKRIILKAEVFPKNT